MTEPEVLRQAAQWLARARDDLRMARAALELDPPSYYGAQWHAQQCAEKALKAVLVGRQTVFPRVHNLRRLCLVLSAASPLMPSLEDLDFLTAVGAESRYPFAEDDEDTLDGASLDDLRPIAERSLRICSAVLEAAEQLLARG